MRAVRSPKLVGKPASRWYRYYAGFSPEFVADLSTALRVNEGTQLVDPWMGSGTTLAVAAARGATIAGLDLNPAMAVTAKGRLVAVDTDNSIEPLLTQVVRHYEASTTVAPEDMLSCWFDPTSVANLRGLVQRIDDLLPGL